MHPGTDIRSAPRAAGQPRTSLPADTASIHTARRHAAPGALSNPSEFTRTANAARDGERHGPLLGGGLVGAGPAVLGSLRGCPRGWTRMSWSSIGCWSGRAGTLSGQAGVNGLAFALLSEPFLAHARFPRGRSELPDEGTLRAGSAIGDADLHRRMRILL